MPTYGLKSYYLSDIYIYIYFFFVFSEDRDIKVEQNYIFSLVFNICGLKNFLTSDE